MVTWSILDPTKKTREPPVGGYAKACPLGVPLVPRSPRPCRRALPSAGASKNAPPPPAASSKVGGKRPRATYPQNPSLPAPPPSSPTGDGGRQEGKGEKAQVRPPFFFVAAPLTSPLRVSFFHPPLGYLHGSLAQAQPPTHSNYATPFNLDIQSAGDGLAPRGPHEKKHSGVTRFGPERGRPPQAKARPHLWPRSFSQGKARWGTRGTDPRGNKTPWGCCCFGAPVPQLQLQLNLPTPPPPPPKKKALLGAGPGQMKVFFGLQTPNFQKTPGGIPLKLKGCLRYGGETCTCSPFSVHCSWPWERGKHAESTQHRVGICPPNRPN